MTEEVAPNYWDMITHSMDLRTMELQVQVGSYPNYAWVRDQVCINSNDPPATFNCGSDDTTDKKEAEESYCEDENPQFYWGTLECDSSSFLVCFLYAKFCRNTCGLC